jgi:hypothetical protein
MTVLCKDRLKRPTGRQRKRAYTELAWNLNQFRDLVGRCVETGDGGEM